jgi:hypothetical protein
MAKNIGKVAGITVKISGEEYRLSLTMLGLDYLDEIYGAGEAMKKFQEMGQQFQAGNVDKEGRDILCHWVRASLIHNQFDETGKKVREIPTEFQIRSALSVGELMGMAQMVLASYRTSFPDPKEGEPVDP